MPQDASPDNVISLDAIRAARRQPALSLVEDYWESLREDRLVPRRDDVEPAALAGGLSRAFLIERVAPGLARVRVAGSHLTELLGMEVRGMPISALFEPHCRTRLAEALETVFARTAVVRIGLGCRGGIGRPALIGGMVLLPLLDRGEVRCALGALSMDGRIGRPPRRPEIRSMARRHLIGAGPAQGDGGAGLPA
ncbi:PAS domain-containing protein [Palleronia sp. KMU-117]|uniref:PAS domain-containing protein n=1 Tax=Palleronia sp. KMU-117 TaxID=3434108 RepID=UPI003D7265DA